MKNVQCLKPSSKKIFNIMDLKTISTLKATMDSKAKLCQKSVFGCQTMWGISCQPIKTTFKLPTSLQRPVIHYP